MINDFGVGGLKIPSIIIVPSINPSKLNWIEKYLDNNNKGKWKFFLNPKKYGCQNFFSHNLNVRDTLSIITTSDAFLKELLGIWAEVNLK